MLEMIYVELSKLIARDIYEAAKKTPEVLSSLEKSTALRTSGKGLPEAVLQELDSAFARAMKYASSAGDARWRDGDSEARFSFYLTDNVVAKVQEVDWAAAAKRTADGTKQVTVMGGDVAYNERIDRLIPQVVLRAIAVCQGKHYGKDEERGWRVLAPSTEVQVAHNRQTDFRPYHIFYMSEGTKRETANEFKRAKKLLLPGWFGRRPPAPFEGPYFT